RFVVGGGAGSDRNMWGEDRGIEQFPRPLTGLSGGKVQVQAPAREARRAGTWIRARRIVPVVALRRGPSSVRAAPARVRLNAIAANTVQATLAVKLPEGMCARAEFFASAYTFSITT